MIDFHILCTRDINTVDVNKAHLQSLDIDLRVCHNKGYSILHGRSKAYNETDKEFVSFIDDDDVTLLSKRHVEDLIALNKDAAYTNGYLFLKDKKVKTTPKFVKEWSFRNEVDRLTSPHETIVYRREYINRISLAAIDLIKKKGWSENTYDYVCRALVSLDNNWYYYPEITYQWNSNTGGAHKDAIYRELREYFFSRSK